MPDHVDSFERMWADLAPVGRSTRSPGTGGYLRLPLLAAETELRAWFVEQAVARGLRVQADGLGNVIGWWDCTSPSGPAVLTGSHLDSVRDGGAYDGALGVVSGLAAVDRLRMQGVVPARSLGVTVFMGKEGSRFGASCLGSRLVTGALSWSSARELRDRDGVFLPDALASSGLDGSALSLDGVGCFVELHVEQGRGLVDAGTAVGLVSGIWPHGRYRFDVSGTADHAGTTRMEDRADPMLTYAMTVLAANKQARPAGRRATFGRVSVEPGVSDAVPSRVTAWLDARGPTEEDLAALVAAITRQASERAERDGTSVVVAAESVSAAVHFDVELAASVSARLAAPMLATQAGHDADVLQRAGIPTVMLVVRNPTGIAHAPAEHAETSDCLAGVDALADVLQGLVT